MLSAKWGVQIAGVLLGGCWRCQPPSPVRPGISRNRMAEGPFSVCLPFAGNKKKYTEI